MLLFVNFDTLCIIYVVFGEWMCYYNYTDFKKACGEDGGNVIPINNVTKNAKEVFNLPTKSKLLEFIYNDGLEELKF